MEISLYDWLFKVDVPLNMEISTAQAKDHCMCGYCRNFYQTIDKAMPSLRGFLSTFGVDIEGPDELSPFEPTIYEASYIVNGTILKHANQTIHIDGVPVKVLTAEIADMDTVRPLNYFVLVIGLIELPWVLDEPQDQVISPANEPAYLRRMEKKLLSRLDDYSIYS